MYSTAFSIGEYRKVTNNLKEPKAAAVIRHEISFSNTKMTSKSN